MAGPLAGVRVVELAAIGPAPFGVMLLADLGAEVIRVDRAGTVGRPDANTMMMRGLSRNRRSVAVDLKHEQGPEVVRALADRADVLVEGFRPGVAERLGIGPEACRARNPRLIYARMTGWGQDGPLADRAGHDIDYAAVAGILHTVGPGGQPPAVPVNYLADFGGGGAYLAIGVLAALFERERSGQGQVVDAAMVDGAASLSTFVHGLKAIGAWSNERGTNLLDGGAPYYDTYECADGRYLAVGPLEHDFFVQLCEGLGIDPDEMAQMDTERWPEHKARIADIIRQRSRDEWAERFAGTDACVAPVLDLDEAPHHPHAVAREGFVEVDGVPMPAPAPRLERTPGEVRRGAPDPGADTEAVLSELGLDAAALLADGAATQAS